MVELMAATSSDRLAFLFPTISFELDESHLPHPSYYTTPVRGDINSWWIWDQSPLELSGHMAMDGLLLTITMCDWTNAALGRRANLSITVPPSLITRLGYRYRTLMEETYTDARQKTRLAAKGEADLYICDNSTNACRRQWVRVQGAAANHHHMHGKDDEWWFKSVLELGLIREEKKKRIPKWHWKQWLKQGTWWDPIEIKSGQVLRSKLI